MPWLTELIAGSIGTTPLSRGDSEIGITRLLQGRVPSSILGRSITKNGENVKEDESEVGLSTPSRLWGLANKFLSSLQQVFFVLIGVFVGLWISGRICDHLL